MSDIREYLGQGTTYPTSLINGKSLLVNDRDLVEQSIKIILGTPRGSRFMLPEFGSRLNELLFEQNDEVLEDLITYFIYEALTMWEKRVKFVDVVFKRDQNDESVLYCDIRYRILQSNDIDSFIYPFYKKLAA